jgi:hypothetical protein
MATQIVKQPHQPLEIADAVAGRVHEGAHGQTIDDGILVPTVIDHYRVAFLIIRNAIEDGAVCSNFPIALLRWLPRKMGA